MTINSQNTTSVHRRITVRVDDREGRSGLVELLKLDPRFSVSVERLPVGDAVIDGWLLIERKSISDLAASIADGRLFRQAARLASCGLRPALILEGTGVDMLHLRMHRQAIQGALVSIALSYGIPILRSRNAEETVQLLLLAARQRARPVARPLPRPGKRPRGKKKLQVHILQGLPGVGPTKASRLIRLYGSVGRVVTAQEEELAAIPGFGPELAAKMRWAIE